MFGRIAGINKKHKPEAILETLYMLLSCDFTLTMMAFPAKRDRRVTVKESEKQMMVLESYEEKCRRVQEFNLISDLIGIELQMYHETAPFKRTRYYISGIDIL